MWMKRNSTQEMGKLYKVAPGVTQMAELSLPITLI